MWERKSLVSGLWRRHREVMSRGSGVCSHVAPGVCSSFAIRDSFPAGACLYPKAQRCLRRRLFYQHQKRQCARNLVERRSTLFLCFSLSWARAKLPWPSLIRKVCPAMFGLEVSGHLRCARTLPLDALFDIICYSDALRPLSVFQGTFGRVTQHMSRIRGCLCKWDATGYCAMSQAAVTSAAAHIALLLSTAPRLRPPLQRTIRSSQLPRRQAV